MYHNLELILKVLELTKFNHKVNMSSVTMMGEEKKKKRKKKAKILYTHILNKFMKYSRTVLLSVTGHVVETGIYNCLHL